MWFYRYSFLGYYLKITVGINDNTTKLRKGNLKSMFDKIIFWLTAPLKVLGIKVINAWRKAFNRKLFIKKVFDQSILTEMSSDAYIRKLNIDFDEVNEIMRSQYHFIDDETAFYNPRLHAVNNPCLLYTSDAADE